MSLKVILAGAAVTACLAVQPAAASESTSFVVREGDFDVIAPTSSPGPVSVSGNLPQAGAGSYSVSAKAGDIHLASSLSSPQVADVHVQAQVDDSVKTVGGVAGQTLLLHKTLTISGGSALTGSATAPGSGFKAATDLEISGIDVGLPPIGPYFPSTSEVGVGVFATSLDQDINEPGALSFTRNLPAPRTIDYAIPITVGQVNSFAFIVDIFTELTLFGIGTGSSSQNYDLNFNSTEGYFTLADENGKDTGVRVNSNIQLVSDSGVNYLADFSSGAGAVPEPAAWELMIAGFGGAGAMLRRRRAMLVRA